MMYKYFPQALIAVLLIAMLFFNRKVRLFAVIKQQLRVFRDAKKNRFSIWDFLCFVAFPIVIGFLLSFGLNVTIDEKLASTLSTVFSLVFTVLFGFSTLIVGKLESKNELEKRIVGETFVSIVSSTLLSMISVVLSIVITEIENKAVLTTLSALTFGLSIIIVMLLLMTTKRTFIIYNDISNSGKK